MKSISKPILRRATNHPFDPLCITVMTQYIRDKNKNTLEELTSYIKECKNIICQNIQDDIMHEGIVLK